MESLLSPPELPPQYRIVTAASHPQLLERWLPISRKLYTLPFVAETVTDSYDYKLSQVPVLASFQWFMLKRVGDTAKSPDSEELVARCSSVPFYWAPLEQSNTLDDALQSLPDDGWNAVLEMALSQISGVTINYQDPPNALCALEVLVVPECRKDNLAVILIERMRALANFNKFKVLTVPVRPTLKHRYPRVPMQEYIHWTCEDKSLPFDPWLRKHCQLGGKILKVCSKSNCLELDIDVWERHLNINIWGMVPVSMTDKSDEPDNFFEVEIPGAVSLLKCYPISKKGVLTEPNVWLYHQVTSPSINGATIDKE